MFNDGVLGNQWQFKVIKTVIKLIVKADPFLKVRQNIILYVDYLEFK